MRLNEMPFNIFIMDVTPELIRSMRATTTTEIFETGTRNFNRDGLFSVETYGTLGSPERDGRFSYINLNTSIFHPLIYKRLGTLKRLYTEIIEGTRYAIFDEEKKDFIPADETVGETGFAFFVKHFPNLVIEEGDSEIRNLRVRLINENRNKAMLERILVMPAGLRDLIVGTGHRKNLRRRDQQILPCNDFHR
ncbi:putative DNA-directed RNA polymerase beta subunit [Serratia phage vB_SmaM_ 2050HW]|uniref:Putative DNA-directed RNA polymerase beta subunit n=1 Tax=Serratia phage vB_SmaM_ 2050HW TaxID=2024252 RepID=A0A289ZIC0_9CAUD|nr:RNA polymerase beta subunit [Serratia phage vB_SmaM_ 2050HW]ATA65432.1 putative DNA-directed RNA polymerase beta subunit [Serratia phage vB_SmaM_ 2050HW]